MLNNPIPNHHLKFYLFVLVGMCAVILSALAFEHIGGYQPCKLCLAQREPWYIGIPVMVIACLSLFLKWPSVISRSLIAVAGIIMIYSLILGVHHSGVEWQFWEGPGDCGLVEGGLSGDVNDLLSNLDTVTAPSCTLATLRVFGLSFAGWNALMSAILGAIALWTAFRK